MVCIRLPQAAHVKAVTFLIVIAEWNRVFLSDIRTSQQETVFDYFRV